MVEIRIEDFKGRIPRRSDRLLPPTHATEASNVDLASGELRGLRSPVEWKSFSRGTRPVSLFRVKEPDDRDFAWFSSSEGDAELVKSPLVNDAFDRWYLFAPGQPARVTTFDRISKGQDPVPLKVVGPVQAPSAITDIPTFDSEIETRTYVITYVTSWGEETAASPSVTIEMEVGKDVTLGNFYNAVTPSLDGRSYKYVRIYRTVVGETTTALRFVKDLDYGRANWIDSWRDLRVATNSELTSFNDPPPDGLEGARVLSSGALVAFKGRDLYFTRPYLPHAWPEDYKLTLPDVIVALEIVDQMVLVLTHGSPVAVYGTQPELMQLTTSSYSLPAVSYRSVLATKEGVYFATYDGIMVMNANGATNITDGLMSRLDWKREFFSVGLQLARQGDDLVAYDPAGKGFIIAKDGTLTTLRGLQKDCSLYTDRYSGEVGLIHGDTLYHWNHEDGEESYYRWRSKEYVLSAPENFETVQVELTQRRQAYEPDGYLGAFKEPEVPHDPRKEVIFRAWADQRLVCEIPLEDAVPANMPRGFKATSWLFEVEGQCRLHSVTVSATGKGQARG